MSEKKRSTYKRGDKLALPAGLDRKNFKYRWLAATRLAENTDGYEERGFELHKDTDGKVIRRGDLILGQMPIDQYEGWKQEKDDARQHQMELTLQAQAQELDREGHEFRKKGGKVKFNFEQN